MKIQAKLKFLIMTTERLQLSVPRMWSRYFADQKQYLTMVDWPKKIFAVSSFYNDGAQFVSASRAPFSDKCRSKRSLFVLSRFDVFFMAFE